MKSRLKRIGLHQSLCCMSPLGDSGGPLPYRNLRQVGLTSFGPWGSFVDKTEVVYYHQIAFESRLESHGNERSRKPLLACRVYRPQWPTDRFMRLSAYRDWMYGTVCKLSDATALHFHQRSSYRCPILGTTAMGWPSGRIPSVTGMLPTSVAQRPPAGTEISMGKSRTVLLNRTSISCTYVFKNLPRKVLGAARFTLPVGNSFKGKPIVLEDSVHHGQELRGKRQDPQDDCPSHHLTEGPPWNILRVQRNGVIDPTRWQAIGQVGGYCQRNGNGKPAVFQ